MDTLRNRKKNYSDLVRELHQPTQDPKKLMQSALRLDTLSSVRSAAQLGGMTKREYLNRVISEVPSRSESTKNSTFRPNPMLPPVTEARQPKHIDFLGDRRQEREHHF